MNVLHTSLLIRFRTILFLPNDSQFKKHPVSMLKMNMLEGSGHHTLLLSFSRQSTTNKISSRDVSDRIFEWKMDRNS